ncbi:class I SAM-dependent methyltransferase [Gallaecimonas kandeliae]|uniref:class I SAM-dependent methyltransferase n=1 Tax=Gallaecimonas kandeliae TaxID=3029055 RepID=UPI0026482BB7|nr:class I SAM-dependent methyltransferase [Gallaecimonas kandeliae]WKE66345.1 class I SAM-dependent methyltransferase [Gallaecimonas kandeliae]
MSVDFLELGRQLRTPSGAFGLKVAEVMNENNATHIGYCLEALALAGGESLLEVGPGNGRHVPALLQGRPQARYLGLDLSPDMVAAARALLVPGADFRQGNLLDFDAETPFDKALAVNVAYFWQPLAPALARLHQTLKVGGTLVLGVRSKRVMAGLPQFAKGFNFFEGPELAKALEDAGFGSVRWQRRPEPSLMVLGQSMELESLIFTAIKEDAC